MPTVTVMLEVEDNLMPSDMQSIRSAILQLRGVTGLTVSAPDAKDRLAYQRIRNIVEAAVAEALNNLDTEEPIDGTARGS